MSGPADGPSSDNEARTRIARVAAPVSVDAAAVPFAVPVPGTPTFDPRWRGQGVSASPAITPGGIAGAQHAIGNRAVSRMIANRTGGAPTISRHTEGTELPKKDEQVDEIKAKLPKSAPAAIRGAVKKAIETREGSEAGATFEAAPKLTRGAMSLASAQKILQGAWGDVKDIVPPASVEILADQPACSAKYDEVCMADGVLYKDGNPWQAGDCARWDAELGTQTEGFEYGGKVYVNGKTSLVTATAHEILHANTAAGFRAAVGETLNEGITETLARKALSSAGITVPAVTAYPEQIKITEKVITFLGEAKVAAAYFGGADSMITAYEALKGTGTWATLKKHAEALDLAKVVSSLAAPKLPSRAAPARPLPTPPPTPPPTSP